jgi:spore maturation protein CgeB
MGSANSKSVFDQITSYCRSKNIPTILWDTEDSLDLPLYLPITSQFDYIFTADEMSRETLKNYHSKPIRILKPAIQPRLHNPMKPDADKYHGFSVLFDGWADILENPEVHQSLEELTSIGLHVIDSRYLLATNKLNGTKRLRKNIMGCVSYTQLLNLLRHYKVLIVSTNSLSSRFSIKRKVIEAIACGCSVFSIGSRRLNGYEDIVTHFDKSKSIKQAVKWLLSNELERNRNIHIARRSLLRHHTYAHRLREICDTINIEHNWLEHPKISVILATKRPRRIDSFLDQLGKQTYPNIELIIINNSTKNYDKVEQFKKFPHLNIKLRHLHPEHNLGTCLNSGINEAAGGYWFKMDDDDYYGPHYIEDMINITRFCDIQIAGKSKGFIYFESGNDLYLSNTAIDSQFVENPINLHNISGATLMGKVETKLRFSEDRRSSVDTNFLELAMDENYQSATADIWSFAAHRSSDKSKHTWRDEDHQLKKKSIKCNFPDGIHDIMI